MRAAKLRFAMIPLVKPEKIQSGKYYWWVFPKLHGRTYNKRCLVHAERVEGEMQLFTLDDQAEHDLEFYLSEIGGEFRGPVEVPE